METRDVIAARAQRQFLIIAAHIICWLMFLSLPGFFNPLRQGDGFVGLVYDLFQPARLTNALLLIGIFYFNNLYAIPRLYLTRRYAAFATTVFVTLTIFFLVNYLPRSGISSNLPWFSIPGNILDLFMFLIVYLVAFVICISQLWRRMQEEQWSRKMAIVTERLSPHILFNTLNSIYALSLAKSDEVPSAIVKLSQALRYTMDEGEYIVPLEKEIEFVRNYVALEKMRLPPDVEFTLSVATDLPNVSIPRFLLVPFLEGAIRSVLIDEDESNLSISITSVENQLTMCVEGSLVGGKGVSEIFNEDVLSRKLELHYPGNYELDLKDNGHIFVVTLRLRLS